MANIHSANSNPAAVSSSTLLKAQDPDHRAGTISILIATRSRPEMIAEVIRSLQANTSAKEKLSLWIYVDDDDHQTLGAIDSGLFLITDFTLHWHTGRQTGSLGEMHEALWNASGRTSDIYMVSVDDARFDTAGWDDIVRNKFADFPDGILLAFPHDPMSADTATYPIFGQGWLESLHEFFPGYFPYWFDDRWVGQIASLVGRFAKIPIVLYPIRGKGRTKRMKNLPFWTRFFQLTLEERKEAARKLISAIHQTNPDLVAPDLQRMEVSAKEFEREKEVFSDVYAVFQEERHTDLTPEERTAFNSKYFKQETFAVCKLIQRAQELAKEERFDEAMTFLDAIQLSDMLVRQAQLLKADCLEKVGQNREAERLRQETLVAWPQMNALRRLFRFLGMIANDGKRLLVGITEKGKTKPSAH